MPHDLTMEAFIAGDPQMSPRSTEDSHRLLDSEDSSIAGALRGELHGLAHLLAFDLVERGAGHWMMAGHDHRGPNEHIEIGVAWKVVDSNGRHSVMRYTVELWRTRIVLRCASGTVRGMKHEEWPAVRERLLPRPDGKFHGYQVLP